MVANADGLIDDVRETTKRARNGAKGTALRASIVSLIEQICCSTKLHAYAAEKEWRCFRTLTNDTPLTVHLSEQNRRYVEMPFVARDVIQEVVLSPHGDKRIGRSLAQYFRSSLGLDYEITESAMPFRR